MERLYRITPLEKKNVEYFIDVFERLPGGSIRGFDVTQIWRWGVAYRSEDDPVWTFEPGENGIHCRPDVGWGLELEDLCSMQINFSDGFTEEEKAGIQALCRGDKQDEEGRHGNAWIYDGDHNWEIEDDRVRILGPVKIDLLDEHGAVLEENVALYDDNSNIGNKE